jgi:DNA (cytosine-5)-methyltransferase 1
MLTTAGWEPGQPLDISFGRTTVIRRGGEGARYHLSRKRKRNQIVPVLDLNNKNITQYYHRGQRVKLYYYPDRIEITCLETVQVEVRKVEKPNPFRKLRVLDICSGAGIASAAFCDTSLYELVGAADIVESCLESVALNHRNVSLYLGDARLWEPDEFSGMRVDVVTAGIPCTPYSRLGMRDAEISPTKSLPLNMLKFALRVGAKAIYFENVPAFLNSLWFRLYKQNAEAAGGRVYTDVQDSFDYGSLASRRRCFIITLFTKKPFDFPKPNLNPGRRLKVKHYLSDIENRKWLNEDNCATIRYFLHEHRHEQAAKGNNFDIKKASYCLEDEKIMSFTASYSKLPATGPWIEHPSKPGHFSQFEPEEISKILGVPDWFQFPEWFSRSTLMKLLGQSVDCRVVSSHATTLAGTLMETVLKAWRSRGKSKDPTQQNQIAFSF